MNIATLLSSDPSLTVELLALGGISLFLLKEVFKPLAIVEAKDLNSPSPSLLGPAYFSHREALGQREAVSGAPRKRRSRSAAFFSFFKVGGLISLPKHSLRRQRIERLFA